MCFCPFNPPLQLLETVKRFMTLRVKSDKEYAALLLNMTQQTEKQEAADYISPVSKVRALLWSPLGYKSLKYTESYAKNVMQRYGSTFIFVFLVRTVSYCQ